MCRSHRWLLKWRGCRVIRCTLLAQSTIHLSIPLSIHPSINPSIHPSTHPYIYPYIYPYRKAKLGDEKALKGKW
ncbi:hypothetical protein GQ43DRAFT_41814 [Delitschia confertaspora ATCC 74209]|uniref:Uncharacterized protein n=1 Tax=Delitschia confertaspora ATCC 74209 TaxID=1513339 RepID=A0A9P4MYV2_9PLEO|nr:hypothetical protein GQ43DRAFT_41814 [Delitschia confertaspora ATCC 74209]